jgi:hypothetical protein
VGYGYIDPHNQIAKRDTNKKYHHQHACQGAMVQIDVGNDPTWQWVCHPSFDKLKLAYSISFGETTLHP